MQMSHYRGRGSQYSLGRLQGPLAQQRYEPAVTASAEWNKSFTDPPDPARQDFITSEQVRVENALHMDPEVRMQFKKGTLSMERVGPGLACLFGGFRNSDDDPVEAARYRVGKALDIVVEALREKGQPTIKRSDGMMRIEGRGVPGHMALIGFPHGQCRNQVRFNIGEAVATYEVQPDFDMEASRQSLMHN
jgi:hypothetical protein